MQIAMTAHFFVYQIFAFRGIHTQSNLSTAIKNSIQELSIDCIDLDILIMHDQLLPIDLWTHSSALFTSEALHFQD